MKITVGKIAMIIGTRELHDELRRPKVNRLYLRPCFLPQRRTYSPPHM